VISVITLFNVSENLAEMNQSINY